MQNSDLVNLPGIVSTICANQFHYLPKNGLEILKLVSKIALENETRVSV